MAITTFGLFINIKRILHQITSKQNAQSLDEILTDFLSHLRTSKKRQEQLEQIIHDLEIQTKTHVQKVGFIRFNPFTDIGGDQSFSLALLDGHNSGFVISSLHGRDRTRIFAKLVVSGKDNKFELSHEEQLAVTQAKTS